MDTNMELLLSKIDEKLNQQTLNITAAVTKNVMEVMDDKLKTIIEENNYLKTKISELEQKLNNIQNDKRRNNLVFFGLKKADKNECELVDYIKEMIIDTGIPIESQEISNVFRIGRRDANKNRPIVVSFTTTWKKHLILRNKSNLVPGIYIKEDYSKEVLEKRKLLQPQCEEERKKGNRVFIKYDKLVIKPPKDKQRDKRKRDESGSPSTSIQKKINAIDDTSYSVSKPALKDILRPNILKYIERSSSIIPPQSSKN